MGYRRMKKHDLWEIARRWQAGQSLSHIAVNERRDRKTVRYYLEGFATFGLVPSGTSMDDQHFYRGRPESASHSKRASCSWQRAIAASRR